MFRRAYPLLITLAIIPVAVGQSELPPLIERVEVKVINVDVTVTDSRGNPVTDLQRGDFEVFEDGQLQRISNFSAFAGNTTASDPSPSGIVAQGDGTQESRINRRIVLLVDNNYIDKVQRDDALRKIDTFIDATLDGHAEWAVASIGQRVEIVQTFTADKTLLHKATIGLRSMPTFSQRADVDRSILSDGVRRSEMRTTAEDAVVKQASQNYKETVRFQAREQTWRALRAVTNTAKAVAEMSRTYSAVEGRKLMVLLTGGMEMNTTFSAYDTGFDREIQQTKLEIVQTIDDMVREANAANFTVDVLNAKVRGMIAPQHDVENKSSGTGPNIWRTGGGNEPIDTTDVDSSALTITTGTGGAYLTSNVLRDSLDAIDRQSSHYYSLGYSPRPHNDYAYHRISVKVKRPGVRVAHRQGYVDLSSEDRLEQVLRARLTVEQSMGRLPVAIQIGKGSPLDDRLSVPVTAELPLENVTLVPIDGNLIGRIHVYVSVFDANGNNVGFSHKMQEVKLSPAEYDQAGQFRYTVKVRLGKGAFKVLVTLRDELSNELGSAVKAVSG